MSIAALYELQERLYQTAIAGVNVIDEDFRLHRSIEQFQQLAGASPVFKRISEQLTPLRDSQEKDKALHLLDALALVDAVLITQGPTDVQGELKELGQAGAAHSRYYELRYSELHSLKSALIHKGSGRYEVVRAAFDAQSDALRDFRLRGALITALGDSYTEMGDLVVKILASGDQDIIPLLKQQFDPKGKREMARRVEVIEKLAKEQENEFYLELIQQKTSAAVRLAAIRALKHDRRNTELLISLAETEKGDQKEAAFSTLAEHGVNENREFWLKHVSTSPVEVSSYLINEIGEDLADAIAAGLRLFLEEILAIAAKQEQRLEMTEKQYNRLHSLLAMTVNKSSQQLLDLFADLPQLSEQLQTKVKLAAIPANYYQKQLSLDLAREANEIIARGIALNYNKQLVSAGSQLYERAGTAYLQAGFCAALVSKSAAEVYEQYSPYLTHKDWADVIVTTLSFVRYDEEQQQYRLYASDLWSYESNISLYEELDVRWFEQLVREETIMISNYHYLVERSRPISNHFRLDERRESYDLMLMGLMNTKDKRSTALLQQYFIEAASIPYSEVPLLALKQIGANDFRQSVISIFQHPKANILELDNLLDRLELEREQELEILQALRQLARDRKITHRYYTFERIDAFIDSLISREID